MKRFLFVVFTIGSLSVTAQILPGDSSVQVIGYWSKNEMQTYNVVNKKYKVVREDTLDVETTKYQVDVKILDSTANSYRMALQELRYLRIEQVHTIDLQRI